MLAILAGMLGAAPFYLVTESLPFGVGKLAMVLAGAMTVSLGISEHHRPVESEG
jgi:hypothetical protein